MTYRIDIQALRGFAILLVLVYHARLLPQLNAGHLGVDVFFVVSGYLITGIIQRALLEGTFTFTGFYIRRAKRLLPAAYVTFAVTILLSSLFLTRPEMQDFTWQVLGAVTFTGNVVLWMQTGYFEGAAHLKPLLHVWSLSIEEQYYLLLPAALVFTPRRFWKVGVLAVVLSSLLLCLALLTTKPGAVFYLLPTRAWELALGSLGILALEGSVAEAWLARLFWPALAALLVVPFFPTGYPHPGLDALIVCSATLIILLRRHPLLNQSLSARGLAHLGDISYSLYLVHWPLLAFAANAWVSPVPGWVRAGLVVLSLLLAWALYRWVEDPIRRATIPANIKTIGVTVAASSILVLISFVIASYPISKNDVDFQIIRKANTGLGISCEYSDVFSARPECQTSEMPRLLIWGDSYAMHLVEGIRASTRLGLLQATRSTCGPFLKISMFSADGWYNREWAKKCIQFNADVLDYLSRTKSIDTVVLSSLYGQYLKGNRILRGSSTEAAADGEGFLEEQGSEDLAVTALAETISSIRQLGKRVVLVTPPPSASGIDFGRCLEMKAGGKLFFGADQPSCAMLEAHYRAGSAAVRSLIQRVARESDIDVVRLDEYLCHDGVCGVELNGTPIYRDTGHLSVLGSRLLGQHIGLADRVIEMAR